jgi:choline/glycine/proline betaine transport protein
MRTQCAIKEKKDGKFPYYIQPATFFWSTAIILGFVVITIPLQKIMGKVFSTMMNFSMEYLGWTLVLEVNLFLIYCIYLMFSKYAHVKIGGKDAEPEFSNGAWVSMLFSAGLGIGLLYFGVAEPMYHFIAPPFAEAGTKDSALWGLSITYLHWGLHGWAIFAVVGLGLAFATFNRGLPLTVRTVFYPLLGDRIYGPIGNIIDIVATACTLFGVATPLGLGSQQINAGLSYLFGIPQNAWVQIILITIITCFATISVVLGLKAGIKRVSILNMSLAATLFGFVLIVGPTLFVLNLFIESTGHYLQNFIFLSTWSETFTGGTWQNGWTCFYWAWWISWGPFVGMFIGRISYGRSVREFIGGVLIVPTILTFIWMSLFGGSAIWIELFGNGGIAKAVQENIPSSFFVFLQQFPWAQVSCGLSLVVVTVFFVTSSDSGSMVIDMITAGGHIDPPKPQRVYWASMEGIVAAALLVGGGLVALQTATTLVAIPFGFIIVFMCWSLQKGLEEYVEEEQDETMAALEDLEKAKVQTKVA